MQGYIFRFVSILGERYTHGHVFDFYKSLRRNPLRLRVLGDGHQRKSYLYIQDCLDAMFTAVERAQDRVNPEPGHRRVPRVSTRSADLRGSRRHADSLHWQRSRWIATTRSIFLRCANPRLAGAARAPIRVLHARISQIEP